MNMQLCRTLLRRTATSAGRISRGLRRCPQAPTFQSSRKVRPSLKCFSFRPRHTRKLALESLRWTQRRSQARDHYQLRRQGSLQNLIPAHPQQARRRRELEKTLVSMCQVTLNSRFLEYPSSDTGLTAEEVSETNGTLTATDSLMEGVAASENVDVPLLALAIVSSLLVISVCISISAWTYRRRKKMGRYDVVLVKLVFSQNSSHVNDQKGFLHYRPFMQT